MSCRQNGKTSHERSFVWEREVVLIGCILHMTAQAIQVMTARTGQGGQNSTLNLQIPGCPSQGTAGMGVTADGHNLQDSVPSC